MRRALRVLLCHLVSLIERYLSPRQDKVLVRVPEACVITRVAIEFHIHFACAIWTEFRQGDTWRNGICPFRCWARCPRELASYILPEFRGDRALIYE